MTLEEFYAAVGGNYSGVLSRIRNEAMIKKFVIKYTADKTCDMLKTAFEEKDWQTAFRAFLTVSFLVSRLSASKSLKMYVSLHSSTVPLKDVR